MHTKNFTEYLLSHELTNKKFAIKEWDFSVPKKKKSAEDVAPLPNYRIPLF